MFLLVQFLLGFPHRCEGEPSCAVSTSDRSLVSLGDPCPGTPKYLEIHYECERGTTVSQT